ncbi:carbohydrate ABC transporter permease [Fodinicola acaciae]|uniref:carbohydrate ABC transporter permease n=1 Tax=Fodinicola acaciae TaxID=2681555 RepID=UPI0013D1FF10|nr:sugar ABC transporter permease [Fodinicola acaciae]
MAATGLIPRVRRPRHGPRRVVGQKAWTPYLFMLPGLLLFALMFGWPAFISLQMSVSSYRIVTPVRYVGLDNFLRLAADPQFHHAIGNTFLFMAMFLPFAVVLPLFLAMLVNRRLRGIHAFRAAYYLPVVTSMVAVAVAWRYLLSQEGVVNWLLSLVGLGPIDFLLDTHWALPALAVVEGWKNMGLFMVIYLAALQGVPREHLEAATVDGAGAARRLWHIVLPAILPYVTVTLTLGMLESTRSFESIYVLTRGGPQDSTLTLGYYIWHTAFEKYDVGYASAAGLVLWLIMIGLALANQRLTRRRDA